MDRKFWKATAIRAVRTFLQVILAVWTAGTLITEVDWKMLLLSYEVFDYGDGEEFIDG